MVIALTVALLGQSVNVPPLTEANSFVVEIPWDDGKPGTITDMSRLNVKPAGRNGRILVKDGVFIEEKTGQRTRFLGTNMGGRVAFPTKLEADKLAARLAKYGINIVRLHHLHNGWEPDGTVWKKGRTFVEIDPAKIDELDYLIAALIKQGIYINMNLQTSREYVPELGFPEEVKQIPNFQKKIDKVDRRMIALQKQYARDLLDRTNPYLGRKYKDEPGLAVIEINNENSLVGWPGESPGAGLDGLPPTFRKIVVNRWNEWLKSTYKTDAALAKAWPDINKLEGPSLTTSSTQWTTENQSNSDVSFSFEPNANGAPTLIAEVRKHQGPGWHIQAHVPGLDLANGQPYTVMFRAKADRDLAVPMDSRLDKADWRFLGLGTTVRMGKDWQDYLFTFVPNGSEPNHARIGFVLGEIVGKVWISDFRVVKGVRSKGVPAGESLAAANLSIPGAEASPRFRDWTRFLVETETAYSNEMRDFLRKDLGFDRVNIIDTQISWGGLTSLTREAQMEFADNHAYWNHPTFLGAAWDPVNYRVDRRALVNELTGSMGTLADLAYYRVAGKPYTVSEYNHPAPNDFQSEMMPLYANFGAMHDWDILYTFAYADHVAGRPTDRIQSFFDTGGNPAVTAFYPASAMLIRQGLVSKLGHELILEVPKDAYLESLIPQAHWGLAGTKPNLRASRIAVRAGETRRVVTKGTPSGDVMEVRRGTGGDYTLIDTPRALTVTGFISGQKVETKLGTLSVGTIGAGFGSLMLVAMDGKPLAESEKMLLTVVGRVENTGMKWNAERNSVGDQWGTGPIRAEAIPINFSLKTRGAGKVYALDGTGERRQPVPTATAAGQLGFEIGVATGSVWYELSK